MKIKRLNTAGFSHDITLVLVVVIVAIIGVAYEVASHANQLTTTTAATTVKTTPTFKEYTIPTPESNPTGIARSEGNLWFSEGANKIGKITPAGAITEYPVPTHGSSPHDITAGPQSALWFTEYSGNKIGKIDQDGTISEYPIPTAGSLPNKIANGINGAVWFSEDAHNDYGKLDTTKSLISGYMVSSGTKTQATDIATSANGELWILAPRKLQIVAGGAPNSGGGFPLDISVKPAGITRGSATNGLMWFTETNGAIGSAGQASLAGSYTVIGDPTGITAGPRSSLWFTEPLANKIGQITYTGATTYYNVPTANARPQYITAGPNNTLWFTESNSNKIGELIP